MVLSGGGTKMILSNLPGLLNAGSKFHGVLVVILAAIHKAFGGSEDASVYVEQVCVHWYAPDCQLFSSTLSELVNNS